MKNLFFTAIAMVAFSLAGNATNLVNSVNSKKAITIEKVVYTTNAKSIKADDCTWVVFKSKTTKLYFADGTIGYAVTNYYHCV